MTTLLALDGSGPLALQLYRALRAAILPALGAGRAPAVDPRAGRATTACRATPSRSPTSSCSAKAMRRPARLGTYVPAELPEAMTAVAPARRARRAPSRAPVALSAARAAHRHGHLDLGAAARRCRTISATGVPRSPTFRTPPGGACWRARPPRLGPRPRLRTAGRRAARCARRSRPTCSAPAPSSRAGRRSSIVNGSQQGLDLSARVLLDPGARAARGAALSRRPTRLRGGRRAARRCRSTPTASTSRRSAARRARARVRHPVAPVSRPARDVAGAPPGAARWAERAGAYVIEDDYDSEYRYAARPVESLQGLDRGGRVHLRRHLLEAALPGAAARLPRRAAVAGARLRERQGARRHRQRHARAARARRLHPRRPLRAARAPLARAQCRAPRAPCWRRSPSTSAIGSRCAAPTPASTCCSGCAAWPGEAAPGWRAAEGLGVARLSGAPTAAPPRDGGLILGYAALTGRKEIHEGVRRLAGVIPQMGR